MTTSQALSTDRGQSSTSFPQAGQLDWVALARLPFSCTWEVAARLCNAGVATVTVIAGRGLCSTFSFPPEGQEELANSLSRLKGSSSYSKLLWFGLGMKHIVNDLCATEPGATCVAICAAMAIPYTSFQAAQVWRELSMLRGAPQDLIPARNQWSALIDVCAGSLTHSKFPIYFAQFCRFLAPNESESRAPASPKDIAKALATLADLSNRTLVSAVFIGGLDCAWLAAIAEYLLRLRIQIQDEHGKFLYGSTTTEQPLPFQAVFQKQSNSNLRSPSRSLIQRVCFVSNGELLLGGLTDLTASAIRSPTNWSNILTDTFSQSIWRKFMTPPVKKAFNELVQCIALHSKLYFSSPGLIDQDDLSIWWLQWPGYGCLYHPRRSGPELLKYTRENFKELEFLQATLADGPELSARQIRSTMESKLLQISAACGCSSCTESPAGRPPLTRRICLKRTSMTVVRLMLILAPVEVHRHIPPSTTALLQLYNCTIDGPSSVLSTALPCQGIPLILFLFSGHLPTNHIPAQVSAASVGGICVFLSLLRSPGLSPLEATNIEVIPGHISSEGHFYTFLVDTTSSSDDLKYFAPRPQTSEIVNLSPSDFDLVVEEKEEPRLLGASYRALRGSNKNIYMSPAELQQSLRSFLRTTVLSAGACGNALGIERALSWSFHQVSPAIDPEYRENSVHNLNTHWSILAWDSWPCQSGNTTQNLDVEVFEADYTGLLVMVSQLYSQWAFASDWNQRSHVIIAQLGRRPDWLTRLAIQAWSNIHLDGGRIRKPALDRTVVQTKMNNHKKKGTVKIYAADLGAECEEVQFELLPVKSGPELAKAPVELWSRLVRNSKSAGKK